MLQSDSHTDLLKFLKTISSNLISHKGNIVETLWPLRNELFFPLSSELAAAVLMNVFHSGVYTYLVPVKSLAKEKFFFF